MGNFNGILARFMAAAESGEGPKMAALFTEDGIYTDGFYGDFKGREAIAHMIKEHFHGAATDFKWEMKDPVSDGRTAYANYLFSYTSKMPGSEGKRVVFEGVARFTLEGDLIKHYWEVFDRGTAMAQLDFPAERVKKSLAKFAETVRRRPDAGVHLKG